jgi:AcrR family transcriptional regulator
VTRDETKERIVRAGLEVLRRGDAFLLGAIAREAGVSRQALYLHFESRGALAVAVARYSDEVSGLEAALRPVREATDGAALLRAQSRFVATYNEKLYPVVRMADAHRQSDPELRAAWDDRLANRRAGGHAIAGQLARWGELAPAWTVETAGDWITALASVKLWEELVRDLGWSSKRFAEHLERLLADSLLVARISPTRTKTGANRRASPARRS